LDFFYYDDGSQELTSQQWSYLLDIIRRKGMEILNPKQQRELTESLKEAETINNTVELIAWIVDCDEKILYYGELKKALIDLRHKKGL